MEQRQGDQTLRQSEAKYRRIFENSVVGIFQSTAQGRFVAVNKAFARMLGYASPEALLAAISDIPSQYYADPEDRGRYQAALKQRGYVENFEFQVRCRDGSTRWVSNSARAFLSDDGRETFYEGIVIDITARKQAQEALRQSELLTRAMMDNAFTFIGLLDQEGRVLRANRTALDFVGASLADIEGRLFWETPWWPTHDAAQRFLQQAVRDAGAGRTTRAEVINLDHRGGEHRVDLSIKPVFDDRGEVIYIIPEGRDMTEMHNALQSISESEERFHKAFSACPAPLVISEIDTGRLLDVNDRWVRMLGYSREEQLGRTSKDVGIWADPGERDRLVRLLTVQGSFKDQPIMFNSKSGETIQALWSAESISLAGKPVMLSLIFDETQRKKAEKEQEKLQQQLVQSQKMELVGRLAGGVAHDFNNMLGVILGHAELALAHVDSELPIHGSLREIHQAAERSVALTRQLLGFARRQTVQPRLLDLNDTLEGMLKMLRRLIGEDIALEWRPGRNLGAVRMDPSQIDQILANLCVNAQDAISGEGRIIIETEAANLDHTYCQTHEGCSPGPYVTLSVSDNGCGMTSETLDHLFEPFYTTKTREKGTGLGLATVYGIVKQNDCYINVYSEPGIGSTFRIYFPRHVDEAGRATSPPVARTPTGQGETILLLEDEPALLEMGATMLTRLGYRVLVADTPSKALQVAGTYAEQIRLLITDVVLPEMSGRELSDKIHGQFPEIKTLFMSGYTANIIARRGVLEEGINFIQKPFTMHDLGLKIRSVLEDNERRTS